MDDFILMSAWRLCMMSGPDCTRLNFVYITCQTCSIQQLDYLAPGVCVDNLQR